MLEITNLKKAYGKHRALDNLSMYVEKGSVYGFVGPNGAGKTTTMRIIAGLLKPDAGSVVIDGMDALLFPQEVKGKIGYMPDFFGSYDNLTVTEYMMFYAALYKIVGKEAKMRCDELLQEGNLTQFKEELVDHLSRGQKQMLCFLRTQIHHPKLLVLDEPAAGMEPKARRQMQACLLRLAQQGTTVLLSSHILTELSECCTQIGILENGHLVTQGDIKKIMMRQKMKNPMSVTVLSSPQAAAACLKQNDKVSNIMQEDNTLTFLLAGGREEEALLLEQLLAANVRVISYTRKESNLEDIFIKLTQ